MKIVVTSNGIDLDADVSPVFGRCPTYIFVDTDTMEFEAVDNPAMGAASGAGIQAAQFIVERDAEAVVTGNVGPNAFDVFGSSGVPVCLFEGGTVREAVEAYKAGELSEAGGATGPAHAGMGRGPGRRATAAAPATSSATSGSREEEIAELKEMASGLRKQLAEVMDRLDKLEGGA